MLKLATVLAITVIALLPGLASADGPCRPVFVAGEGVIDSCTGKHRSPYPDPPPQPTIIYVDVTFSPTINVSVVNNVSALSYSVSSANASASSSSNSAANNYIVRLGRPPRR